MEAYSKLPKLASADIRPYTIKVEPLKIRTMEFLTQVSPVGLETYENSQTKSNMGLNRQWLIDAKKKWVEDFRWEKEEAYLNTFPHFMTKIKDDDGTEFDMHFMALFSKKADAIPIKFLHGWPGSFLEFLKLFTTFKEMYNNDATRLPYHLVAPSLPGYAFSSGPPKDRDWKATDSARIINKLMVSIGFESGYISQGGDIGSFISQALAQNCDSCKAIHLNFRPMSPPSGVEIKPEDFNPAEQAGLQQVNDWPTKHNSYAREHGTRPATIGLVLSSSPIALLAWIGEKFLEWTDDDPTIEEILRSVSLYWLTETFPRSIYTYRDADAHVYDFKKPYGFSWFPKDIIPVPKAWIEGKGNLVWFKAHERGGHFAAMEKPKELAQDVEAFVNQVWPSLRGRL